MPTKAQCACEGFEDFNNASPTLRTEKGRRNRIEFPKHAERLDEHERPELIPAVPPGHRTRLRIHDRDQLEQLARAKQAMRDSIALVLSNTGPEGVLAANSLVQLGAHPREAKNPTEARADQVPLALASAAATGAARGRASSLSASGVYKQRLGFHANVFVPSARFLPPEGAKKNSVAQREQFQHRGQRLREEEAAAEGVRAEKERTAVPAGLQKAKEDRLPVATEAPTALGGAKKRRKAAARASSAHNVNSSSDESEAKTSDDDDESGSEMSTDYDEVVGVQARRKNPPRRAATSAPKSYANQDSDDDNDDAEEAHSEDDHPDEEKKRLKEEKEAKEREEKKRLKEEKEAKEREEKKRLKAEEDAKKEQEEKNAEIERAKQKREEDRLRKKKEQEAKEEQEKMEKEEEVPETQCEPEDQRRGSSPDRAMSQTLPSFKGMRQTCSCAPVLSEEPQC